MLIFGGGIIVFKFQILLYSIPIFGVINNGILKKKKVLFISDNFLMKFLSVCFNHILQNTALSGHDLTTVRNRTFEQCKLSCFLFQNCR